jgi:hypothetical protein
MRYLGIAACAALVVVSIPSRAAQPMNHNQFNSHSTPIPHYNPLKTGESKNLPRSTAPVQLLTTARGNHRSEIDHLEHQTASQLQAESRHGVRSSGVSARPLHSQTPSHGSPIAFSYRPPQAVSRSSGSGGRRP